MKYSAFRIDTTGIKDHKIVHGYFVLGKNKMDLNWDYLCDFDNMDDAKEYIKSIRTENVYQPVYGPDGYGIEV